MIEQALLQVVVTVQLAEAAWTSPKTRTAASRRDFFITFLLS
jgi:hypothetical protein